MLSKKTIHSILNNHSNLKQGYLNNLKMLNFSKKEVINMNIYFKNKIIMIIVNKKVLGLQNINLICLIKQIIMLL